jgi:hypothetical protein
MIGLVEPHQPFIKIEFFLEGEPGHLVILPWLQPPRSLQMSIKRHCADSLAARQPLPARRGRE